MKLEAAVIRGDGVGPEMMEEAVCVLEAVCRRFGHELRLYPVLACAQALEAGKEPLPTESLGTDIKAFLRQTLISVPVFPLFFLEIRV